MTREKIKAPDCEVWTALATPFRNDASIDLAAWEKLLAMQVKGKVTGVVIAGSTGEGSTLSAQEKLSLVKKTKAILGNSLSIMASVGTSQTTQSVELARLCEEAGADSLLVVTPPYNKPSQAGLKLHFSQIAGSVKIPVCLYHVPGRTGQKLSAEQLAELCKIPNVTMVKEASADLCLFSEAAMLSDETYLSGDDFTYLPSLSVGGRGVISVISNLFPEALVRLGKLFVEGNHAEALALHRLLFPMNQVLYCESNPGPLKAALHALGICDDYLRPPLARVTESSRGKIVKTLEQVLGKEESLRETCAAGFPQGL
ncbi:MAG: 4-hydroxy-tetrahydrodipicolinate synthase [Deltaproteobacteria bacterium]|nr:4-hydroxy-tetrahydrodipicolinate synthase [Deltaproteobacteria bacterium]